MRSIAAMVGLLALAAPARDRPFATPGAGAIYPGHEHASPEIYYVTSGQARWTVGSETFEAGPETAVYTPPDTLRRMINTGTEPLRPVYFWWAPEGKQEVLRVGSTRVEPVPEQPARAVFPDS